MPTPEDRSSAEPARLPVCSPRPAQPGTPDAAIPPPITSRLSGWRCARGPEATGTNQQSAPVLVQRLPVADSVGPAVPAPAPNSAGRLRVEDGAVPIAECGEHRRGGAGDHEAGAQRDGPGPELVVVQQPTCLLPPGFGVDGLRRPRPLPAGKSTACPARVLFSDQPRCTAGQFHEGDASACHGRAWPPGGQAPAAAVCYGVIAM